MVAIYNLVLALIQIVTGFTRSCCQCIENFEFELIGIKFKFYLTIIDRAFSSMSGPDSLNNIAGLIMK